MIKGFVYGDVLAPHGLDLAFPLNTEGEGEGLALAVALEHRKVTSFGDRVTRYYRDDPRELGQIVVHLGNEGQFLCGTTVYSQQEGWGTAPQHIKAGLDKFNYTREGFFGETNPIATVVMGLGQRSIRQAIEQPDPMAGDPVANLLAMHESAAPLYVFNDQSSIIIEARETLRAEGIIVPITSAAAL